MSTIYQAIHSQVLLCALLGTATSKPVAEADLRLTRSAEAEAKAEPDADALRPFAYSSPAGAVSFSLGAVRIWMINCIISIILNLLDMRRSAQLNLTLISSFLHSCTSCLQ